MRTTSARPADCIEDVMETYGTMLFRLCFVSLGNADDAEDAVQETLIKYVQKQPVFESAEHEKAWLIAVATNKCRDLLRFRTRHPVTDIEEIKEYQAEPADSGILEALMTLPEKFRTVLTLFYVEEYSVKEIADIIGKTTSAVKMRLQKGRVLLGEAYRKEYRE
ncbi:MAG: RNA polymerase sigma factor [Lachnospiraceae bacterium]|nr:RNA polymerase sigma factor [Lachnospiraceae bacterium]MBQ8547555.1 RNA polymerase sigma factor [Lachnospiraceae bacterium]